MTWGIPTDLFLKFHVVISLIGIASGLVAMIALAGGRLLSGWTGLFLATTVLTNVTGFPLAPFGLDPPRIVGIISLVALAVAIGSLYLFHLAGAWRWIYVVTAMVALFFNCFVAVIQSFDKIPALHAIGPTQDAPVVHISQLVVLVICIGLGGLSVLRFHPKPATA
jgi:hypothetical protein